MSTRREPGNIVRITSYNVCYTKLLRNAGAQLWKTFEETSDEEIDEIYNTNLSSTVRFVKQAVPYLEKSKGNIVIVSSTASRYTLSPSQKLSVYGVITSYSIHYTKLYEAWR